MLLDLTDLAFFFFHIWVLAGLARPMLTTTHTLRHPSLSHREGVCGGNLGQQPVRHPRGHRLHPLEYSLHPPPQVRGVLNILGKFSDPSDEDRCLLVFALQQQLLQLQWKTRTRVANLFTNGLMG